MNMENTKLISSRFYVVSLDIEGGGADCICNSKIYANSKRDEYLQECRLRQIEGEVTISCVKVANHSEYTEQDYFDGIVEIVENKVIEKMKISFE